MKAITQDEYGSADVLRFQDIDTPVAGPGQVLLRVRAAAIDAGVWHLMTGMPYLVRLGFGLRRPKVAVRGREVAGVVEAVGDGVTEFTAGDEVFGMADGSFAEYVVAQPKRLAKKPRSLSFEQSAAVSISATTALQALRKARPIRAGQKVLVLGAAGGVGTYAVQLAKVYGAEVTGVCSATKTELVRSIGADHVIDYTSQPIPHGRYDVVLDIAGNRKVSQVRRFLVPRGTLVFVGGEHGGPVTGGLGRVFGAVLLSAFVGHQLRNVLALERGTDLAVLRDLVEEGRIAPVIDRIVSLPEVPAAIKHLQAGNARGKIAVTVG